MFHTTENVQHSDFSYHLDNITQDYQEALMIGCDRELHHDFADIAANTADLGDSLLGFAVKLSILDTLGVRIADLLTLTTRSLLLDAEYQRLDQWLETAIATGQLTTADLDRLIVTIQVKRQDSQDQLANLEKYKEFGLKVLLVAGHGSYLVDQHTVDDVGSQFSAMLSRDLVGMIGCGKKMVDQLSSKYGVKLASDTILELQGYQALEGSSLWSYYGGQNLTTNAEAYLERRKSSEASRFVARDLDDLHRLTVNHNLFVFVDGCCKSHYQATLQLFDESSN